MKALYTFLISCFCVGITLAQSDIASLEYFVDTDPGVGLATAIDINPDAETIDQSFSISTSGLTVGTHRLFIRAINVDGDASMYEHKTFRIAPASDSNLSDIVEVEYFVDQDPGIGNATFIDVVDGEIVDETLTIPTGSFSLGTHRLFVRVKNSANEWSLYEHKTFRIAPVSDNNSSDIVEAEYFVDQDPGIGNATFIDVVDGEIVDETLTIPTGSFSLGTHRLFVRVKNSANEWSLYEHKTFRIAPASQNNSADIVEAEYFVDQDPGIGNATFIDVVDGEIVDEALTISTGSFSLGTHRLFVRVKNSANEWSLYEHKTFRIAPASDINTATITAAEYFIDADPGVGSATTLTVSGDSLDENLVIPTSGSLAQGDHYLHIRVLNADGTWSLYERQLFEIDGTLNINTEILSEITLFPNPTSDYINIYMPNGNQITKTVIYDLNGKQVYQSTKHIEKINISNFSNGTYLLILETEKGRISKKILKN
ncbi:T9SS type A sorting domain-containing protein [Psychroserpens sp.]